MAEYAHEVTLAVIKPDAFERRLEIVGDIALHGFCVARHKEMTMTKEQAEEFYKEHHGRHYYDRLIEHSTSGPCLALGLYKRGTTRAPEEFRELLTKLRLKYAIDGPGEGPRNALHGSDTMMDAIRECRTLSIEI